jgi:hypothetical protein
MLEVASELAGSADWKPKQARVQFRSQGEAAWETALLGSDDPSAIREVEAGAADIAIINPACAAGPAVRGIAPFPHPIALQAIATIPSYDQFGLAVAPGPIETLADLVAGHHPLRISLRGGRPDHAVHLVLDHLLDAAGTSLAKLAEAGHTLRYDDGLPHLPARTEAWARGEIDVIIDEGIYNWADRTASAGWRFLPVPPDVMGRLAAMGYRPGTIERSRYPALPADVTTIDFSGWMIYTHARVPDRVITAFCEALLRRRDRIPWQGGASLPVERMVIDTRDAPIPIPFHPAAERFWRETGLLGKA